MEEISEINIQYFFETGLDSDHEAFCELSAIFKNYLTELKDFQLSEDNISQIEFLAHKVRSSARSFGAERCSLLLKKLETSARERNYVESHKVLLEIQASVDSIISILNSYEKQFIGAA